MKIKFFIRKIEGIITFCLRSTESSLKEFNKKYCQITQIPVSLLLTVTAQTLNTTTAAVGELCKVASSKLFK